MNIQVRLSAGLAYAAGQTRLALALPTDATVAMAVAAIITQHPALAGRLERALPMLGGRHVETTTPLTDGAELLLLLPAAGGADDKVTEWQSDQTTSRLHDFTTSRLHDFTTSRLHDFTTSRLHD
jgi:molybdopterin converting factor small subunit